MTNRSQQLLMLISRWLGAGVLVLAAVCGYQYWALDATSRQIAEARQQATVAKERESTERALKLQQKTLARQMALRRASWSWSDQLPLMVSQVSRALARQGVKAETLQPEPVVVRQRLARFPLRVTLHAGLNPLSTALFDIAQANPVLAVDHLTIGSGELDSDPLKVDLTLSSYVMLDGEPAKGGGK